MDWSKGFSASCYITTVDPSSWRDISRIEITGGTVSRSTDKLKETASVTCVDYDQTTERWIRIWMDTRQEGAAGHSAIFTGLAVAPDRDINGRLSTNEVACYSVLKPAEDVLLPRGWYAPAGSDGAALAAQLLSVTPAPIETADSSPSLANNYIAGNGETNLSMALNIIDAIGWRIRIAGDGTIYIGPKPTEPAATFDCTDNDTVEPQLVTSYDWFACPNVFRVVNGNDSATAVDDDPDSIFSTVNRGREIWMEETAKSLNTSETLYEYARRRLEEEQNVVYSASYDRRFHPNVTVSDLVQLHYPEQKIDGLFTVVSQSLDLSTGCRTSEEVEKYGYIPAD